MLTAATVKPADVDSNIAAWLSLAGVHNPPKALVSASADNWAFWIGLALLAVGIWGLLEWAYRKWWRATRDGPLPVGAFHYDDHQSYRELANSPKRDARLGEAVVYCISSEWGKRIPDACDISANQLTDCLDEIAQKARDNEIIVWASSTEESPLEIVPAEHWREYQIDVLRVAYDVARSEHRLSSSPQGIFYDLMVSRTEFEREWPHAGCPASPLRRRSKRDVERLRPL